MSPGRRASEPVRCWAVRQGTGEAGRAMTNLFPRSSEAAWTRGLVVEGWREFRGEDSGIQPVRRMGRRWLGEGLIRREGSLSGSGRTQKVSVITFRSAKPPDV